MLYLVNANGSVQQLEDAIRAEIEETGDLVCLDEPGNEFAR